MWGLKTVYIWNYAVQVPTFYTKWYNGSLTLNKLI